jgi:predicted amidohydrolase
MTAREISTEDPADLFLELYDEIGDGPFDDQRALRWRRSDGWVRRTAELICAEVMRTGRASRELVEPAVAEGGRGVFAVLMGLDSALMHADVMYGTAAETGEMYDWLLRHVTTGRLNSRVEDGLLLFRLSSAPRPRALPTRTTAFHVLRVPAAIVETHKIDFDRLPTAFDIPFQAPEPDGRPRVNVGCAPMLAGYDELEISARDDDGVRRYRLCPRTEPLKARVRSILEALDRSGATIGVLPEATLSDELLGAWKEALREQLAPWDSNLSWILVGSGPVGGGDPPFNRAVLLSRDGGHEVLCYDKHFDFTLSPDQLRRWRLDELIGDTLACEDIHRGDQILVRECSLGRLAVLICEDLTRLAVVGAALGHLGVSHLLVPIFAAPIRRQSWDAWASRAVVSQIGASVVVSNSLAVGRAMQRQGALGTCSSAVVPEDAGDEWKDIELNVRKCAHPEDVVLLEIPAVNIKKYTG